MVVQLLQCIYHTTCTVCCFLILALLNITPSANNGTFGALHHMLKPEVVDQLPPGT